MSEKHLEKGIPTSEDKGIAVPDVDYKPTDIHLERAEEPFDAKNGAIHAEEIEHDMGVIEAIKTFPKACAWSIGVAFLIVMEAYDNALIGNFFALPAFRQAYGEYVNATAGYQIPAKWQTALGQSANIGAFVGILICGRIADRLGYRWTALLGLGILAAAVFLTFFATSLGMLLAGELLCGIPWGFFINIAPAYASEIAPLALRGALTSFIQICWCIGQFFTSVIFFYFNQREDQWGYRIPFAIQWVWIVPLVFVCLFCPESPWWLVRKGRLEEADRTIKRLGGLGRQSSHDLVAMMLRTTELERERTLGSSYADCFRGTDLRRTIIVCAMFAYQCFTGLLIGFQAVYFFQQAGMPSERAFALGLGNNAIQFAAVCFCWVILAYFGRRTIYLWGVGFNIICCLLIGICGSVPPSEGALYAQATFVILSYLMYGLTIGPVTYTIVAETSSLRLRAQSIGLARATYYVCVIACIFLVSYMLNPAEWNLAGKSAYVWFGTGIFCWTTAYFYLPECKGRTYRELDVLFARRIPARKFSSTEVEVDALE